MDWVLSCCTGRHRNAAQMNTLPGDEDAKQRHRKERLLRIYESIDRRHKGITKADLLKFATSMGHDVGDGEKMFSALLDGSGDGDPGAIRRRVNDVWR